MSNNNTEQARKLLFRTLLLIILLGAAVATIVIFLRPSTSQNIPELENEKGLQILEIPRSLPEFTLLDQNGQNFTRQQLKNQWSVIFFGYTSCPDVCPTTLGVMDTASSLIQAKPTNNNQPVRFIFASVDPVRDTPAHLKEYINYFNSDFIAITGKNNTEIDKLSTPIGATYDYEDMKTSQPIRDMSTLSKDEEYLVNHFASIYIIDPSASVSAVVSPPHDVERFVKIFTIIRRAYTEND